MFSLDTFMDAVATELRRRLDNSQRDAVITSRDGSLFLVAGPGSGKTTVLTLRVLKLVFVDDINPSTILATTFTRRAAQELRSRILGWGDALRRALRPSATSQQASWLDTLDLNRIFTGTLDSIAEQALRDFRSPGMQPPAVLDEFVSRALFFRAGVLGTSAWSNNDLKQYVQNLCHERSVGTRNMGPLIAEIRSRMIHDQVDRAAFRASQPPAVDALLAVIDAYDRELEGQQVLDFPLLEQRFLDRLRDGSLRRFTEPLCEVLVDEYQDTNQLQESVYMELARAAISNGGGVTVVGDDDQSLYRFRGATVQLFQLFPQRLNNATGVMPTTIYLNTNYRSTPTIVELCMAYIQHDPAYEAARVAGKPPIAPGRSARATPYPALTLFRPTVDELATDLAALVRSIVQGTCSIPGQAGPLNLQLDPRAGAIGDIALLCSSPGEYSSSGRERLPLLLRQALEPDYKVFNPRGQELTDVVSVARLCGLMLECIDPRSTIQDAIPPTHMPTEVRATLAQWRSTATTYIATNPAAPGRATNTLATFVRAWQNRRAQQGGIWPDEIELLKLLYDLLTWIPEMQDDAEGLVYLEVITRTLTEAARFSSFDAAIRNDPRVAESSVRKAILDIFAPLASGEIEVDETLLETAPRDRLSILSIHQAKGLEFPLTIVDIGSDFRIKNASQRFKRYPHDRGRAHALEDALHPYSPLGAPTRPSLDRAFDDLVRQYFVAFSRPQDVLLLVGLCDPATRLPSLRIPNVAIGWRRDDQGAGGCTWPLIRDIVTL